MSGRNISFLLTKVMGLFEPTAEQVALVPLAALEMLVVHLLWMYMSPAPSRRRRYSSLGRICKLG